MTEKRELTDTPHYAEARQSLIDFQSIDFSVVQSTSRRVNENTQLTFGTTNQNKLIFRLYQMLLVIMLDQQLLLANTCKRKYLAEISSDSYNARLKKQTGQYYA